MVARLAGQCMLIIIVTIIVAKLIVVAIIKTIIIIIKLELMIIKLLEFQHHCMKRIPVLSSSKAHKNNNN